MNQASESDITGTLCIVGRNEIVIAIVNKTIVLPQNIICNPEILPLGIN